jgi:hypothetical protein
MGRESIQAVVHNVQRIHCGRINYESEKEERTLTNANYIFDSFKLVAAGSVRQEERCAIALQLL